MLRAKPIEGRTNPASRSLQPVEDYDPLRTPPADPRVTARNKFMELLKPSKSRHHLFTYPEIRAKLVELHGNPVPTRTTSGYTEKYGAFIAKCLSTVWMQNFIE